MKLRDGVAENLTVPRVYIADIGEGLNGITDAINCLHNGSIPVGENLTRITGLLSSAAVVLSAVNRELLSTVADGDELENAIASDDREPI